MLSVVLARPCYYFQRQALNMACRKDLIMENDFINKRFQRRNMSILEKITHDAKENKRRLVVAAAFTVFFSLGFIYDALDRYRRPIKLVIKELKAKLFGYSKLYNKSIEYNQRNPFTPRSQEEQALGQQFLKLDRKLAKGFSSQHMNELLMRVGAQTEHTPHDLSYSLTLSDFMRQVRTLGIAPQPLLREMQALQQHPTTR